LNWPQENAKITKHRPHFRKFGLRGCPTERGAPRCSPGRDDLVIEKRTPTTPEPQRGDIAPPPTPTPGPCARAVRSRRLSSMCRARPPTHRYHENSELHRRSAISSLKPQTANRHCRRSAATGQPRPAASCGSPCLPQAATPEPSVKADLRPEPPGTRRSSAGSRARGHRG
jgi:hypothetical protein